MVAERSKATCNLSTECSHRRTKVQIPTRDYNIDRSEVEIICCYLMAASELALGARMLEKIVQKIKKKRLSAVER